METALIAVGGNVGDVAASIATAFEMLSETRGCRNALLSRVYATAPIGAKAGNRFLNAAIRLETLLAPLQLLDRLQSVEAQLGRVRTSHWGPRVIDLDLIGVGQQVVDSPRLKLPHPAMIYRRFVLDPLLEIAPDWVHPRIGHPVSPLQTRLQLRPLPVAVRGAGRDFIESIRRVDAAGIDLYEASTSPGANTTISLAIGVLRGQEPTESEWIPVASENGDLEAANEMARQMLRAALDQPVPLDSGC
jgi:2-amino-4-hydroxy-6-hydroxymethyldihydropteridine diphosphokinase